MKNLVWSLHILLFMLPAYMVADCTGNNLTSHCEIKIRQSEPTTMIQMVGHNQFTTSPDEDQQKALKTSQSTSQVTPL